MTEQIRDLNGRLIRPGDLLRTFHFVAAKRRQKFYLYHVAVLRHDGLLDAVPACHLDQSVKRTSQGRCQITRYRGARMEIIHCDGSDDWSEREKVYEVQP